MNTRMNVLVTTSAALLLGLTWTGSTMAQESSPDMPGPETDRASCDEVDWNRDLLREYPWVVDGCQEAIVIDGEKWARFEGEFQQIHRDGAITADFNNDRGRSLGSVKLMPGPNQKVMLDGRPYQFSELRRGQTLNFYVPDDMYAFTTQPGVPASEQAQVVESSNEQSERDQRSERERRLARAESNKNERPDRLPATAGPLPILALGGMMSLLGGLGLTVRRRLKTPNA